MARDPRAKDLREKVVARDPKAKAAVRGPRARARDPRRVTLNPKEAARGTVLARASWR
jgi:hypothetical protein